MGAWLSQLSRPEIKQLGGTNRNVPLWILTPGKRRPRERTRALVLLKTKNRDRHVSSPNCSVCANDPKLRRHKIARFL